MHSEGLTWVFASVPSLHGLVLRLPANLYLHIEDSDDSPAACIATEKKIRVSHSIQAFLLLSPLLSNSNEKVILFCSNSEWAHLIHFVQPRCSKQWKVAAGAGKWHPCGSAGSMGLSIPAKSRSTVLLWLQFI